MMAFLTFSVRISSRSTSRFSQSSVEAQKRNSWVMVLAVVAGLATSMRTGSLRKVLTSRVISGGMVAEKNSVWRRGGSSLQMRSMSGMKPMSSMRSASSMTRISTPDQQDLAASEVVEQASRGGDQHVRAAIELFQLVVEGDAADQQRHRQPVVDPVFLEALRHLGGELARRCQDQRARHARPGASAFQSGQHRQHETGRLAGARLGDAEHVAAGYGDRNGLDLDGGRRGVAGGLDGGLHFGAETELSERRGLQKETSPCVW